MARHPLSGYKREPQAAACEQSTAFIPHRSLCTQVPLNTHPHTETLSNALLTHKEVTLYCWSLWIAICVNAPLHVANICPPWKAVVWRSFKQAVRLPLMHWMTQWTLITSVTMEKQQNNVDNPHWRQRDDVLQWHQWARTSASCDSSVQWTPCALHALNYDHIRTLLLWCC